MQYSNSEGTYLVRLEKDDDLFGSLESFARTEKLTTGHLSGIGAIKDVELGFYDLEEQKYYKKVFEGTYELLSMSGNLCFNEGKEFFHLHVVLSDHNYACWGGHLFSAKVAVTVESYFSPVKLPLSRQYDSCIGLSLWDLSNAP